MGAHAQLLKPVGDNGAYSALLIARDALEAQRRLSAEIADLRRRIDERQTVVRAVTLLAARGLPEDAAYAQLRRMAMDWRVSVEDAALRVVARYRAGAGDDQARSRLSRRSDRARLPVWPGAGWRCSGWPSSRWFWRGRRLRPGWRRFHPTSRFSTA